MAAKLNGFADVQALMNKFVSDNGTDLGGSPHADYWNGSYADFVDGNVPHVNPPVKNIVKGHADQSNFISILRGPITVGGKSFQQMPADDSAPMPSDLVDALADWINRGCPQ